MNGKQLNVIPQFIYCRERIPFLPEKKGVSANTEPLFISGLPSGGNFSDQKKKAIQQTPSCGKSGGAPSSRLRRCTLRGFGTGPKFQ